MARIDPNITWFRENAGKTMEVEIGGELDELNEVFSCTMCNSTGELKAWTENGERRTSIRGDIEETEERPKVSL